VKVVKLVSAADKLTSAIFLDRKKPIPESKNSERAGDWEYPWRTWEISRL
jgi:hypothetical protein